MLTNAVKLSIQQVRSISSKAVGLTLTGTAPTYSLRPSGQGVQEITEIECGTQVLDGDID